MGIVLGGERMEKIPGVEEAWELGCWADRHMASGIPGVRQERGRSLGALCRGRGRGPRPHFFWVQIMHSSRWLHPPLTNPFLFFPISLIFGALTIVTGIVGVVLGAEASRRYKKVNPRAEPLICASSLLAAAVCLYLALILAPTTLLASYVSEGPIRGGVTWGGMGTRA